ncbi:MAG: hypothetical protein ABSF73_07330 [Terriglobia bacterium]
MAAQPAALTIVVRRTGGTGETPVGAAGQAVQILQSRPPAVSKNGTTTAVYQTTRICGVDVRDESARRKRFRVGSEAPAGGPEAAAIYFPAEVQ